MAEQLLDQRPEATGIVGRERAGADRVVHGGERRTLDLGPRLVAVRPPQVHLLGGQAEDEHVVVPDQLTDLDVGAIEGADGQRAVQRQLHVAGAGRFHAGGRDLLGQIGRRDDLLGQADVVVGQKDHLEPVADGRIIVDRRAASLISLMISFAWR